MGDIARACGLELGCVANAELNGTRRTRLEAIATRLTERVHDFKRNVAAASADFFIAVDDASSLEGMSPRARLRAERAAEGHRDVAAVLTLERRARDAALAQLSARKLRRDLYEAYVTRASDHGPRAGRFDNGPVIQEILGLRHEAAQLAGYPNYAEARLAHAALKSSAEVERFLLKQGAQARGRAQEELDAIWAFAKGKGVPKGFSTWDLPYYAGGLRAEQVGFCAETWREFFALPDALTGLTEVCCAWLGVAVQPTSGEVGRLCFTVADGHGEDLGTLELVPLERGEGAEGATVQLRHAFGELPSVVIRCDLEDVPPQEAVSLDPSDLAALCRALGEALFYLLTRPRGNQPDVAHGTATEAQLAGELCVLHTFEFATLAKLSKHCTHGTRLPRDVYEQWARGAALHAGLAAAQERELSLFDLRVHRDFVPVDRATQLRAHVIDTLAQVRHEVCVLRPPFWDRTPNTCSAIFAGDGAVRSWERIWAKLMAQALHAAAKAQGSPQESVRFLRTTYFQATPVSLHERLRLALGNVPEVFA